MRSRRPLSAGLAGAAIGTLGGLIGLGGAEFRLPLLIQLFKFEALRAVIVNKFMSLTVVMFALPFRAATVPFSEVVAQWPIILNLLAGSLIGAWLGAGWATRLSSAALYKVIAVMMVGIAAVLLVGHDATSSGTMLTGWSQVVAGVIAGLGIGIVAAVMGVAGGELLIPTLILLFGADIKLAGSLSLAVSLPTMIVGFARYAQDQSFAVLRENRTFVIAMAVGSILGAFIGGQLLGIVPSTVLIPVLVLILLTSIKVWRQPDQPLGRDNPTEQPKRPEECPSLGPEKVRLTKAHSLRAVSFIRSFCRTEGATSSALQRCASFVRVVGDVDAAEHVGNTSNYGRGGGFAPVARSPG